METSAPPQPTLRRQSKASRIGWTLLILATLYTCYFSRLGAIGFIGPDEPRYAGIARQMAESGDWVTPRLYGKPWFEKPPLHYWGAAISFKLFGVSEAAARLPSAVSAFLATVILAWLAWRLYGAQTAQWLLLLLPTTVAMTAFSHAAAPDMPLCGALTIAMVCAMDVLRLVGEDPLQRVAQHAGSLHRYKGFIPSGWAVNLIFGVFLGLAVLAKGPVAIALCGGAVFFWALLTKRWRDAIRLLHPAGIIAFGVTALPWYVLCARRNPDFFRIFIIEHNFKRYVTPEFQHVQPFWFYLPITLAALLPWTLLLLPVISEMTQSLREQSQSRTVTIFLASWVLFAVALFSFSKSKLPGYILPAIPLLVLVYCETCTKLVAIKSRFSRAVLAGTCIVAIALFGGGVDYALGLVRLSDLRSAADYSPLGLPMFALAVLLVLLFPVLLLVRYRVATMLCIVLALVTSLAITPLNRIDSELSPRQTCQALAKLEKPGEQILLCDMPRSYIHGFNFYLRREVPEWLQRNPEKPALVVIGSPSCWSEFQNVNYHMRPEMNFARWPVIEVEAR